MGSVDQRSSTVEAELHTLSCSRTHVFLNHAQPLQDNIERAASPKSPDQTEIQRRYTRTRTRFDRFCSSTAFEHGETQQLTSTILSHSRFPCTAVMVTYWVEYPDRSMLSKPSVVPELVQVVTRPGAYTSSVLTLVAPLYIADGWSQMRDKMRKVNSI